MRIVALEEHYTVPTIVGRIDPAAIRRRGFPGSDVVWGQTLKRDELAQLGDARIADMDASGITLQVLSVAGPGADVVPGADGIALARDYNNALFEATSAIRTDTRVLRISRCIRRMRRRTSWNERSRIWVFAAYW
jgi:hypothetical protein